MNRDLLDRMLNISRRLAEIRTLTSLLEYLLGEAAALTGAKCSLIALVKPDGSLEFHTGPNQDRAMGPGSENQVKQSILSKVIEAGQAILLPATTGGISPANAPAMCAPFILRSDTLGAIYVERDSKAESFSESDLQLLALLTDQAAGAIKNARLNDGLEEQLKIYQEALQQARLEVNESQAKAVEANRLQTVWVNNITHDLRTGISVVSGALTLLQMDRVGELNPNQRELVAKAANAIEHTLNLINDLFDFSKLEAGGLNLYPEEVNPLEFLQNVYEVGRGLPWPETVAFNLDLPADLPNISIDPIRIRQVLLNLLSNANKFTNEGQVTLYARYLDDQQQVLFGVTDTGEGIPIEEQDQLFERFFQRADDNSERQRTGSGLGLAISRGLVKLHGGRIWVESTPGVGSNFMFTLPLNPPALNAKDIY